MKKNYYWSIMIATIMAVMSAGFVSCGDDDDDGNDEVINGGSISKIDPVQERLKPFIGLWDIKANDYYHYVTFPDYRILFFQDSKCVILKKENEKIHNLLSWDYDESNKYLSIAGEAKGQWQITSVGDNAWTGLALWYGGNNAYSAEKQTVRNVMDYYYDGSTWMSDSVKATFELNEYYDVLNIQGGLVLLVDNKDTISVALTRSVIVTGKSKFGEKQYNTKVFCTIKIKI